MYALVEIKGKQYKAVMGETLMVDRFDEAEGTKIECKEVLLLSDGDKNRIGAPFLSDVSVQLTLQKEIKGDKIRVFKYKRRKKYRLTQGHRQQYSLLKVDGITGSL